LTVSIFQNIEIEREKVMKPQLLVFVDWNCGRWAIEYRNLSGEIVVELTDYPATTPSLIVSDAIQQARPGTAVLAKLS
jgi:hypothetical protein